MKDIQQARFSGSYVHVCVCVCGLIRNIYRTEFIIGKIKHFHATLSYLLQNTILESLCSNSTDPPTFYCVCGRPVAELPTTAMSYSVVCL
jgi:hypothetical protein